MTTPEGGGFNDYNKPKTLCSILPEHQQEMQPGQLPLASKKGPRELDFHFRQDREGIPLKTFEYRKPDWEFM